MIAEMTITMIAKIVRVTAAQTDILKMWRMEKPQKNLFEFSSFSFCVVFQEGNPLKFFQRLFGSFCTPLQTISTRRGELKNSDVSFYDSLLNLSLKLKLVKSSSFPILADLLVQSQVLVKNES